MISIPRSWARDLRAVFRRLNPSRRHSQLVVELSVQNNVLTAHCVGSEGAAEFCHSSVQDNDKTIVPLDALADCEGKDSTPVTFALSTDKQVEVRWTQNGVPQVRTYGPPERNPEFPESPLDWTRQSLDLLDAIEEAVKSTAESATRYALDHIQFKGSTGEVIASDGKQLLIRGGFAFPWPDDVLISRIGAEAARAIGRVDAVHVGRRGGYLWLRTGPWSLSLPIDATGRRYPDVHRVIAPLSESDTRLVLNSEDADTLVSVLSDLPGAEEPYCPVTVDLNGRVAVRARAAGQTQATELLLTRSQVLGPHLRFVIDRRHLSRARKLGFDTLRVISPNRPIVCRNAQHVFVAMPLHERLAIPPTDDVLLVDAPRSMPAPTAKLAASVVRECAVGMAQQVPVVVAGPKVRPNEQATAVQADRHQPRSVRGLSRLIRQQRRQSRRLKTMRSSVQPRQPIQA